MSKSTANPVEAFEFDAACLDTAEAAAAYREHGCLVVRGLMRAHVERVHGDIERAAQQAINQLARAERIPEGWRTPDGTLFLPAPASYKRDKQIMVLGVSYRTSAALFQSALDPLLLDVVEAVLGPDIELFGEGQCLYKEPAGGHPKHLHQDAAYFEHRFDGPVAVLCYAVPTDLTNGALHVVPGSHRKGMLQHIDTFSHLGLDPEQWPWESAAPITGAPGDAIFFHVKTVHGSQENHSDAPRPVFIHRYRHADDYIVIGATNTQNRAQAEKLAHEATKVNQLGLMVRGFRKHSEPRRPAE